MLEDGLCYKRIKIGFSFLNIITKQVKKDYPEINKIFLLIKVMNILLLK